MDKVISVLKQYLPMLIVMLLALYIYFTWIKPCSGGVVVETDMAPAPGSSETPVGTMVQASK